MGKLKSKTERTKKSRAKRLDVKPADRNASALPSTEQLAMIAATLARNTNLNDFMPSVLTKNALDLWLWAQEQISIADIDEIAELAAKRREGVKDDLHRYFKPSDKYPVTRDEFIKRVLPQFQGRVKKMAEIGKAYRRVGLVDENLINRIWKTPTTDEIEAAYDKWGPFHDHVAAATEALYFKTWYDEDVTSKRRVTSRRNAAQMRKINRRSAKKKETSGGGEEYPLHLPPKDS